MNSPSWITSKKFYVGQFSGKLAIIGVKISQLSQIHWD